MPAKFQLTDDSQCLARAPRLQNARSGLHRFLKANALGGTLVVLSLLWTACGGGGPPPEPAELSPEPPITVRYGYQPRACGFDLDDDGVIGEEQDDCRVCDGQTSDPDGDGVDEDMIYIDCQAGNDAGGCGGPDNPCATIQYAWSKVADGAGDGAEDILCFRNVCREENIHPQGGGLPKTKIAAASGHQERDWEYPSDPAMLVGWDSDADGRYPPYDGDDTAVLDGGEGLTRAFRLGDDNSYLELAHFTVRDYGRYTSKGDTGWLKVELDGTKLSHVYAHDQELVAINMDRASGREISTVHLSTDTLRLHWLEFSNLMVRDNGGAFALGAAPGEPPALGPYRWQHITRTAHSCSVGDCEDGANSLDFAFSGYVSGVEVLDSAWYANIEHWRPKAAGGISGSAFATVAQFNQDWLLRNNYIVDHKNGLIVRGAAAREYDARAPRPVDNIVFDRNIFWNTFEPWKYGDAGVDIRGGDPLHELVGTVTVSNNFLTSTTPWDACIEVRPGNDEQPLPGQVTVVNNTCNGPVDRYAAIVIGNPEENKLYAQQNVTFLNNAVHGLAPQQTNLLATFVPSSWRSDGNVYDENGTFRWADDYTGKLDNFQFLSGGDEHSRFCAPAFVSAARGDLHLSPLDTCLRDAGVDASEIIQVDIDDEPRGQGAGWDAGADELPAEAGAEVPSQDGDAEEEPEGSVATQ